MINIETDKLPEGIHPAEEFIEAAFKHSDFYVIFSSANAPFEETLAIQLFEYCGKEVDRVLLYNIYSPGILEIEKVQDEEIDFHFWSKDAPLRLSVLENPKFLFNSPPGIHYKGVFSRHRLKITFIKKDL